MEYPTISGTKIAAAFVKAQKGFAPALKTSTNPHFKSRYADLAACVEAVIDALNAAGIALMQKTHESESGVMVETTFIHESGEIMSGGRLHIPAQKHDAQGFGSALSYARRYSLMAACGIAPEDDDGNAASKPKAQKPRGVDLDDVLVAMREAPTLEALKKIFGDAWKIAAPDEQKTMQSSYERLKNELLGEQA